MRQLMFVRPTKGRGSLRWSQQDFKSRLVTPALRVEEKTISHVYRVCVAAAKHVASVADVNGNVLQDMVGNEARLAEVFKE